MMRRFFGYRSTPPPPLPGVLMIAGRPHDAVLVEQAIAETSDLCYLGAADHGRAAIGAIEKCKPALVLLDMSLPGLEGVGTLSRIVQLNHRPNRVPVPVLIVSDPSQAAAQQTIQALRRGVVDFIARPSRIADPKAVADFSRRLLDKIRLYCPGDNSRVHHVHVVSGETIMPVSQRPISGVGNMQAILIGISTGGPKTLMGLLPRISARTTLPILIVQHMPSGFTQTFANSLDLVCAHHVCEARTGQVVEPGMAYVAPGDYHLTVQRHGRQVQLALTEDPPENGCRPAVDVLFRTAAAVWGEQQIAMILTGMGSDGTIGARALKQVGATVLVQDEASSIVWGMPGSAFRAGVADHVVALDDIPLRLSRLLR